MLDNTSLWRFVLLLLLLLLFLCWCYYCLLVFVLVLKQTWLCNVVPMKGKIDASLHVDREQ